ncbi:D-alanyl-D-alanine carboxypeptidase family protein [Bacillus sp. 1NLA3E]|uniref:D-alanyl-D-alanine carboxypeptidase family protein n=1 Tax=Bacillus sp. 1NLA3E TaxID=666686 RepID=UPI000247E5F6|nr:D-alanyl-D-alanine carboxypeptidase family protein [Bacillus sp. 1NLA3E]
MRKIFIVIFFITSLFIVQLKTFAHHQDQLMIKSEAAVVMDAQTGAVLYGKNADEKMYPASLTKIATAIYAIENGDLQDKVTISKNVVNTDGTKVYLEEGEVVTLHHLLQGMLINSGNDAAVAIAEHLNGSDEQFSNSLNKYLKEKIGVTNTHFTNPNGLFDENHYTTAEDLAKITNYAMKNNVFKEIFGTKELQWDGLSWDTTLITHHQMLKGEIPYPGITGGKTGYVDESKQTLATTADNGQMKLTAIVLKADNKKTIYNETIQLLDYGFQNFKTSYLPKSKTFTVKNKKFKLTDPMFISEPINGVNYVVSNKGLLQIQTKDLETVQTVQLTPVEKEIHEQPVSKIHETKEPLNKMNALYGTLFLAVSGLAYSLIKKNKK